MSEENKNSEFSFENESYRKTYWHTCSHILAQAVKRLYPEVKLAIGPSIDEGFYYDMDSPFPFTPEILEKLEGEMRKICKEKLKLERFELPREEALKFMEEKGEPYKVELIHDLPEDAHISFYKQGEFTDLCAGPHLDSTGRVKGNAIKLTACNAAYWRGDSSRQTLQRIYGIAFPKKDELDAYLQRIEEAKKRDHRRLGKELGLFTIMDEGPGFPFFLPKGMVLKNTLIDYWRQVHKRYGYVEISTPIMLNRSLWERSGHWDHYKNNMYTTVIDEEDFAVKPMNCPGGMLVYKNEPHSYRDLPLRVGELGLVHRHELSGALHGLFRVRCFNQDDAHVFMTREQMQDVIQETVRLFDEVYSTFGLSYTIELSTMPEDHIGTVEEWERNQDILKAAITDRTKAIILTSPNNPTGCVYTKETLDAVHAILRDKPIFVLCDDVYRTLTYCEDYHSFAEYQDMRDRIIVVQSFSKPYAMTGWRLGYCMADAKLMDRIQVFHQYCVTSVPSFVQRACVTALETDTSDVVEIFRRRRDYVYQRLVDMGLDVEKPEGAFYMFVDIRKFGMDSNTFCTRMLKEGLVGVIPGIHFGTEGFMRLSYCYSDADLKEGLDRIEKFIKSL